MVEREYICFLLYSEDGKDDEATWMKLTTDNLLRISCLGKNETGSSDMAIRAPDFTSKEGIAGPDDFVSSLVTIVIGSRTPSQ